MSYTSELAELIRALKPKKGLEVGLYKGLSAKAFLANCKGTLVSIDHNDIYFTSQQLDKKRFTFIMGDSSTVMKGLKDKFDYIYIDGDHSYEGCKADIEAAIPLLTDDGTLVMDDYGVTGTGGQSFDVNGDVVDGVYGVKQATDELLGSWRELPYVLPNGGKAFKRK